MEDAGPSYHYNVIRRALGIIDAAGPGLTLGALAGTLGMSEAHFQRLFSAWVGVSPKRYQQYLALGIAREMLARRAGVLEAAEAAGAGVPEAGRAVAAHAADGPGAGQHEIAQAA